jgi:hypothetical protein
VFNDTVNNANNSLEYLAESAKMNRKGREKNRGGLFRGTFPAFAWRD